MKISDKNYDKIERLYLFCALYVAHRDFDLAKVIAKHKPLTWEQAESISNLCNQLVKVKEAKPQDFISGQDEMSNKAIDKYLILKDCLSSFKIGLGAKGRDKLYKSVKSFYRKKAYHYQMDTFYTFLIHGLFMYVNEVISFEEFVNTYCFEVSLFDGQKKPINLRYAIKMSNYILEC